MVKKQQQKQPFRFKSHNPIGAVQAELDHEFLENCFIETGDLDAALDIDSPRSVIIGRTGVGKSALLMRVKNTQDHAIEVAPENLSIDYIANSSILGFFEEVGVNLDVLFCLLWRHVLVTELLRYRYNIHNKSMMDRFICSITEAIKKDRSKEKGLNYLKQWGDSFWEETEYRVKEVVSRIESELKTNIGAKNFNLNAGAGAAKKLTDEERKEVLERGKQVVAKVQIKDLGEVIRVLADNVFIDKQKRYFLIIDGLDENWADQSIRYKLIRALLEELRKFRKIQPLKILVSLRLDLLEKVFENTRDAGFQEEKYRDLLMPIRWNREHLYQLVKARIEYVLRYKYTTEIVNFEKFSPLRLGNERRLITY